MHRFLYDTVNGSRVPIGAVVIFLCVLLRYNTPTVTDIYRVRDEMKYIVKIGLSAIIFYAIFQQIPQFIFYDSSFNINNHPVFRMIGAFWIFYLATGATLFLHNSFFFVFFCFCLCVLFLCVCACMCVFCMCFIVVLYGLLHSKKS